MPDHDIVRRAPGADGQPYVVCRCGELCSPSISRGLTADEVHAEHFAAETIHKPGLAQARAVLEKKGEQG